MLVIVIAMIVILLITAALGLYVAFPHRGVKIPAVPWVGNAMSRGVDKLPTIGTDEDAHLRL